MWVKFQLAANSRQVQATWNGFVLEMLKHNGWWKCFCLLVIDSVCPFLLKMSVIQSCSSASTWSAFFFSGECSWDELFCVLEYVYGCLENRVNCGWVSMKFLRCLGSFNLLLSAIWIRTSLMELKEKCVHASFFPKDINSRKEGMWCWELTWYQVLADTKVFFVVVVVLLVA